MPYFSLLSWLKLKVEMALTYLFSNCFKSLCCWGVASAWLFRKLFSLLILFSPLCWLNCHLKVLKKSSLFCLCCMLSRSMLWLVLGIDLVWADVRIPDFMMKSRLLCCVKVYLFNPLKLLAAASLLSWFDDWPSLKLDSCFEMVFECFELALEGLLSWLCWCSRQ